MNRSLLALALMFGCSSVAFAGPPRAGVEREHQVHRAKPRASPASSERGHDDRFTQVQLGLRSERVAASGPLTVYVNGDGARLRGGYEDAAANRSSIVASTGFGAVEIPAFSGGDSRWQQVMRCVDQQFADFDVVITDARPEHHDYIMLMVGGSPAAIGENGGVAGIAPFTGSVIPGAVGFAFSEVLGNDAGEVCETVAHEIGHTLGLDHTHECTDTMSYLDGCGDKWFRDLAMSCGEWDPRTCNGGAASQNSHAQLASALGLRPGGESPAPPLEPETPEFEPEPEADPWIDWSEPTHWRDDPWNGENAWGSDDADRWDESAAGGDIEWVEPDDWDGWSEGEWVWVEWVEWGEWDGASACD